MKLVARRRRLYGGPRTPKWVTEAWLAGPDGEPTGDVLGSGANATEAKADAEAYVRRVLSGRHRPPTIRWAADGTVFVLYRFGDVFHYEMRKPGVDRPGGVTILGGSEAEAGQRMLHHVDQLHPLYDHVHRLDGGGGHGVEWAPGQDVLTLHLELHTMDSTGANHYHAATEWHPNDLTRPMTTLRYPGGSQEEALANQRVHAAMELSARRQDA